MALPIATDGQQVLRQLVKDVERLKRTGQTLTTTNLETGVDTETIYLSEAGTTDGAVFVQDTLMSDEVAATGPQDGDDKSYLTAEELWVVTPSPPLCSSVAQAVSVLWDGLGAGDERIPANFGVLEIHRSLNEFFEIDNEDEGSTLVGVMTYPGTVTFTNQMYDVPYYYRFRLVTADRRFSDQSDTGMGIAMLIGAGDIDSGVFDELQQDTLDKAALDAAARDEAALEIAAADAALKANAAEQAANAYTDSVVVGASGNSITMSVSNPSGTPKVGDLWFKLNAGGEIIGQWGGTAGSPNPTWEPQTMNGAVLTNLQAGSITAGTLDAARIGANTITGDKIVAGTLTVGHTAGLQGQLNAKTTTFAQNGVPIAQAAGDIWIDTDDNNKQYRAAVAGADQIVAGEWVLVEPTVITTVTFAQPGIPTSLNAGDLWFDTDDGNKQYRAAAAGANTIASGAWVLVASPPGATTVTFAQPSIPTSVTVGDIWVDTDDGNKMYRAAMVGANEVKAGEWVYVSPTVITTVTFAQPAVPTSLNAGDLWVDTDDNNKMYRAAVGGADEIKAGEWVLVSPTVVTTQTFAQPGVPTAVNAGDLWIDTDDSNKMYRAAAAGVNSVGPTAWVLIDNTQIANTAATVDGWKYLGGTTIDGGDIQTDTVTAAQIAANSIRAKQMVLADTSNFAEVNESFEIGTIFDNQHVIVSGWSTRASTASTYFMFRDKQGPVPFKTGDRIRITFEAYADVAITPNVLIWGYGAVNVTDTFGAVTITTTPTTIAIERTLTADYNDKQIYMLGLSGGAANMTGRSVFVRNVRAYRMGAGELIVDGGISARHIAAQSIQAEKLALGALSTNLVPDPSFEEPYPFLPTASAPTHQWCTMGLTGAATFVERSNRPNSGLNALRMGKGATATDAARMRSGAFPVIPGKTYSIGFAMAKENNTTGTALFCRIAAGSTTSLTEYPGSNNIDGLPILGDAAALENLDPPWISPNLYPYLPSSDENADGIHDGATAYSSGTVTTGTRAVNTAGQVLSAASMAVNARWGTLGKIPVKRNIAHRLTLRHTGLTGTNARLRWYIDGVDTDIGPAGTHLVDFIISAGSGSTVLTTVPADYDLYNVYVWLEPTAGLTATSPTATITSIEVEQIDAAGLTLPTLEYYLTRYEQFTVPAGMNYAAVRFHVTGGTTAQSIFVDDVTVLEVGKGGSELTAAGLRIFNGLGQEVGAFVSNRPNLLSISREGEILAGISEYGAVSGQTLSVAGVDIDGDGLSDKGMEIYGTEFLDWVNQSARGEMAWIQYYGSETTTVITSGQEIGLFELGYDMVEGRAYWFQMSPLLVTASAVQSGGISSLIGLRLRVTTDGTQPTLSSPIAHYDYTNVTYNTNVSVSSSKLVHGTAGQTFLRCLVCIYCSGCSATPYNSANVTAVISDIGPIVPESGTVRNLLTGTPAVPVKKTYTTTYTSTTAVCYMANGSKDSSQGSADMKQGYSSYDGDSESLWIFPSSMRTTMMSLASAADITKVRVYLYANFWYYNAGGTAKIMRHNYASAPSSSPSQTYIESSSSWPKPGGRWVDITSSSGVTAALKAGTMQGIGVGPAGTTSQTYYGRFNKAGAKIEITYKK